MLAHVRDVMAMMEERAPREWACEWDNVGLQIGHPDQSVERVLVALDLSMAVLDEALLNQATMIVVHHPVLFRPLQALHTGEPLVALLSAALQAKMAVFAAHTNLDVAPDGVSHVLAEKLGLKDIQSLPGSDMGAAGTLREPLLFGDLADWTRTALNSYSQRTFGNEHRMISKAAVCGGSGGNLIAAAVRWGAQVLITGDIGYHDLLEARDRGLNLIDAGHAPTERPIVDDLVACLRQKAHQKGLALECLASEIPSPQWNSDEAKG